MIPRYKKEKLRRFGNFESTICHAAFFRNFTTSLIIDPDDGTAIKINQDNYMHCRKGFCTLSNEIPVDHFCNKIE